jgi:hypothetical protein
VTARPIQRAIWNVRFGGARTIDVQDTKILQHDQRLIEERARAC